MKNIYYLVTAFIFAVIFIIQIIFMGNANDLLAYTVLFVSVIGFLNEIIRFIIPKGKSKLY
ncbi:hypothetical protein GCM10011351_31790 [Paraliobacillus quinghaiensis]|uniref:Uncharacterized protein n=1 Tax=Paraliobacillus quinghaiensis TaxID=470815 RepID=A0A917TZ14_9BACI|nr:hypothetical protein [Paraliobacillus quinghaiensis]GGM43454.1 hypothetical protein GCM10011351_31790 [Paraliobacillus quinghaiensis]